MSLQGSDRFLIKILLVLVLCIGPLPALAQKTDEPPATTEGISYGFVIDNSGSFRKLLEDVIQFVAKVTEEQKPADEVFFIRYADSEKVKLDQEFTSNRSEINDSAEGMYIQ